MNDMPVSGSAAPLPTVAAALNRGYQEFGEITAVLRPGQDDLSYRELGRLARILVGHLQAMGLQKGDRIVSLTKNRSEGFIVDHALALGGFVRVALSYRLHVREVVEIMVDARAAGIIVDGERTESIVAELARAELASRVIGLDPVDDDSVVPFESLLEGPEAEPVDVHPDDVAWMPYTSGTSGHPKGVVHTHRSLMSIVRNMLVELPGADSSDVLIHTAPLTHLSGYAMLAFFLRGASHLAVPTFDPAGLIAAVEEHRATVLPLVPTMINSLLPVIEDGEEHDVSSVHTILYGGSAIAPERLARAIDAFGLVFLQSYGLTEFPWASWLSKGDHEFDPAGPPPPRLASAGRVGPFVEFRLMTPQGPTVADGEVGEIQIRGDASMSGYWNLPEETAATLVDDGWIITGDVGRMKDGYLHVVDRQKDMIVSGGFNIYPTEVENAIYNLPSVAEVAVVGVPDERWGERVHAVVVVRSGHEVTEEDVVTVCRENIAPYKKPQTIEFVEELPKTSTGKIMRRTLKEIYWEGQDRMVGG